MNVASRLARMSLAHPRVTLAGVVVVTLMFALGIPRIERETTARTFLGPDHPVVLDYDDHIATFGGGYPVTIAYSCDETPLCESVFDPAALEMAYGLSTSLSQQFGVFESHSPATESLIVPVEDGIVLRRLVENGVVAPDVSELAGWALEDPLWDRLLVSEAGTVGAVVLEIASTESHVQRTVADALEASLEPLREQGWRFHLVGELVDFTYAGLFVEQETQRMALPLILALSLALFVFLRSLGLVVVTIGTMGMAYSITNGAMGWAGFSINALTAATPSVVMAVAILDAVHLIARCTETLASKGAADGRGLPTVLLDVCDEIGPACWLTSLTTMAAFASFSLSGVRSFAEFGLSAAFGVIVAFALAFTALPVLLTLLPEHWLLRGEVPQVLARLKSVCRVIVHQSARTTLAMCLGLGLLSLVGLAFLRVDISPEHLAGTNNPVSSWSRWVAAHMHGTEGIEVSLEIPDAWAYADPLVLRTLDELAGWIESELPGIRRARSVRDTLSHLRGMLNSNRPGFRQPSESRAENAELGFLLTLQDPRQLERWATGGETTRVRISAEADPGLPMSEQARVVSQLDQKLRDFLPRGWGFSISGSVPLYVQMMGELQAVQILCFGYASLAVFLLMWFHFRSLPMAAAAMIPTALPVLGTLGLLGWAGVALDPGTTMVAAIGVGVGVDDSIHILSAYRRRRAELPPSDAALGALDQVASPVIISSLMLGAGFLTLSFSALTPIVSFGLLASLTVLAALVSDLLLLPSLLSTSRLGRDLPGSAS